MRHLFGPALPLSVKLPLLTAACVFLAAIATTQVASRALEGELNLARAQLGRVYLDGLAAALARPLAERDAAAIRAALADAMGVQEGVRERQIVVWPAPGLAPILAGEGEAPPRPELNAPRGWEMDPDSRSVWVRRLLPVAGAAPAVIAARLDFSESLDRRAALRLWLLALDLVLAGLAALLAAWLLRRALAPLLLVAGALDRAGAGDFRPIPAVQRPEEGTEAARLVASAGMMLARLAERDVLAARLAERERAALLGELAATIAHEVRNPLAGMLTAIGSLRRFGGAQEERARACDLLERGLRQIERVVQATLETHRGPPEPRPLAASDFQDLEALLRPEARRRGVALRFEVVLARPFPADALAARQALLNLLLNALAATPAGGMVSLGVEEQADGLRIAVSDQGPGLPEAARRQLSGEGARGPGLGLSVVMTQIGRLDGRIEVDTAPGQPTRIVLHLPWPAEATR
jgi:two-component system OmpR family sensor kinase